MSSSSSSSIVVPTGPKGQAEAFPDGTTDFKPMRGNKYDIRKVHISETPMTWGNWYKHIDWLNTTFTVLVPCIGLVGTYWVPLQWKTLLFAVIYYFNTGLGITAGS